MSFSAEEFWAHDPDWSPAKFDRVIQQGVYLRENCPYAPHRGPEGPNEDVGQCPGCGALSWELRPEGQTFGHHLPDCSLPVRHESYCQPGGSGHPPAETIRGYFGPGSEES